MGMTVHPLVQTWIDRLVDVDVEGLLDLYDVQARMNTAHESWEGHDEIADGLRLVQKYLRGVQVEELVAASGDPAHVQFETTVRGVLGRARIHHDWHLGGDRIHRHTMTVLHHDKTA